MKKFFDDNIGDLNEHTKKPLLKVIREKCLDCCVHKPSEVRKCHIANCSLWPYRMGKNPFSHRRMTGEQKESLPQRLQKTKNEE